MPRTRKHFRSRRFVGGSQLPLSHFSQSVKTIEEYKALTEENKFKYEKTVIEPLIAKLMKQIPEQTSVEDKVYYLNLIYSVCMRQFLSFLGSNPNFRKTSKVKISEFLSNEFVKEHGTPELFESFDYINKYIQSIDTLTSESIHSLIDENNAAELRKFFHANTFRALFKSDLTISYKMFYGSDELVRLLGDLLTDTTTYTAFEMTILKSEKSNILVNLITPEYDKNEFKRRIDIMQEKKKLDIPNMIEYICNVKKGTDKLAYFLDAVKPPNLYTVNTLLFSPPQDYGEIILNAIYEINAPMSTSIFRSWIEWIYSKTKDIEKTKYAIDFFFRNITESVLNVINGLIILSIARMHNSELFAYGIDKLLNKYGTEIKPYVDKLLFISIEANTLPSVKQIIELGFHTNELIEKGITLAEKRGFVEVAEYLKSQKPPEPMWEGWTRSDISKFDMILSDEGVEKYSVCPICLKYVQRTDGCLYMSHDCAALTGFYHKRLYELYSYNPYDEQNLGALLEGGYQKGGAPKRITWCTSCGRICYGHQHYALGPAESGKPSLKPHGTNPFEKDCRDTNYGGGFPEKVARFRRVREYALELEEEIGKLTQVQALEELVEQMWNAPFVKTRKVNRIIANIATGKPDPWNIPSSAFRVNAVNGESNAPNIPYTGLLPIVHEHETAEFTNARFVDNENILQFQHTQENGVLNSHDKPGQQISREAFRMFVGDVLGNPNSDAFGKCWQFYTESQKALLSETEKELVCTATLHPEEVKSGLDMNVATDKKLYEGYKKQFNRKFKV